MFTYVDYNNICMCLLLIVLLSLNKRFLRSIITIVESSLIIGATLYFLSHYKDIAIFNMIVAYNPFQTIVNLLLRLNLKPSGALSQFSNFTFNEICQIVLLTIRTKLISPVTTYIYNIRQAFLKALSEIGFTNIEETYYNLYQ